MADFFDKVIEWAVSAGGAVKEAGAAVADKGGQVVENTRLRIERVKLETNRKEELFALGESFYGMFTSGLLDVSDLKARCERVRGIDRQIEALGEKPDGAEESGAGEKDQNEGKEP